VTERVCEQRAHRDAPGLRAFPGEHLEHGRDRVVDDPDHQRAAFAGGRRARNVKRHPGNQQHEVADPDGAHLGRPDAAPWQAESGRRRDVRRGALRRLIGR
jgi:hypothetical protein